MEPTLERLLEGRISPRVGTDARIKVTRVIPTASSQVYDSLKDSGEMPEASLAYFDADGAEAR